ncbi:MFS transporter [Amycolatopsis sp. NPDC006125]|uniref:MFS transporter n=1 Tax=Amycolatopsis sp. NPDC006125 TaxID=3156730 RepID=UPI0033B6EE17
MTRTSGSSRRAAVSSLIGTTIEWYDFFIYGNAAALVFGPQFFPRTSTLAATLAAYGTFAVGFLARPLGGIVMGHFGDRVGRKRLLVLSLLLMGFATCAIGLLPTYAAIGVWAPALLVLLRLAQGFGVGGEWGAAVLMSVEHAPAGRRGLFGAFPQMGLPAGVILSNGVFLAVSASMSRESFLAWGWRVPFLLSAVLIVAGLTIRLKLAESPEFTSVRARNAVVRSPLRTVLRTHPKALFLCSGASIAAPALGYLVLIYLLSYGTATLHLSSGTMLSIVLAGSVVWLVAIGVSAAVSDRYGRKRVFLAGAGLTVVWAVPLFLLVDTASVPLMVLAVVIGCTGIAVMAGPQAALVADSFTAEVRYSGSSIAYQVGSVLGGALAPIVATALVAGTGTSLSVSLFMAALGLVSLVSMAALAEPKPTTVKAATAVREAP